jgi:hypothetical protein
MAEVLNQTPEASSTNLFVLPDLPDNALVVLFLLVSA